MGGFDPARQLDFLSRHGVPLAPWCPVRGESELRAAVAALGLPLILKTASSGYDGKGQILVVPDLEAGNMLAKNLIFLAKADSAGLVLGARVPIVLTSRADSVRSRMASCAAAALYADSRRRTSILSAA